MGVLPLPLLRSSTIAHSFWLRKRKECAPYAVRSRSFSGPRSWELEKIGHISGALGGNREKPRWPLNNVVMQLPGQFLAGGRAAPPQGVLLRKFITKTNRTIQGGLCWVASPRLGGTVRISDTRSWREGRWAGSGKLLFPRPLFLSLPPRRTSRVLSITQSVKCPMEDPTSPYSSPVHCE